MSKANGDLSPLSPFSGPEDNIPGVLQEGGSQPAVFQPITIRGVTAKNRLWVAPMCQYSCKQGTGVPSDYHLVHLGQFALHGAGLIMTEASAVLPNGRIAPGDVGIWNDEQMAAHKRITEFEKAFGAIPAIQIAHAGRKASNHPPWDMDGLTRPPVAGTDKDSIVSDEKGGFRKDVFGPSAVAFDRMAVPKEIDDRNLETLKAAYVAATKRSVQAGYEVIEIHGAHGYLFHSFCSPISNKRTDKYGGSFENRIRLPLEIAKLVRENIPADMPLLYRVSATDWHVHGEKKDGEYISWGEEQTALFAAELLKVGVDLIDVSSAGNDPKQDIKIGPGYQVPFAQHLKENPALKNLKFATVGLITKADQAEEILQKGQADVIMIAREFLRTPSLVEDFAYELGAKISTLVEYERAHTRLYAKH